MYHQVSLLRFDQFRAVPEGSDTCSFNDLDQLHYYASFISAITGRKNVFAKNSGGLYIDAGIAIVFVPNFTWKYLCSLSRPTGEKALRIPLVYSPPVLRPIPRNPFLSWNYGQLTQRSETEWKIVRSFY